MASCTSSFKGQNNLPDNKTFCFPVTVFLWQPYLLVGGEGSKHNVEAVLYLPVSLDHQTTPGLSVD